jgi:hypothetical protein
MGKLNYSPSHFVIGATLLKGYLLEEFSDSEELQSQFHEVDVSLKTLEAV